MCGDGSRDAILSCIIHCNGKNKNHFYAFYVMNKRRKSLASNVSKTYDNIYHGVLLCMSCQGCFSFNLQN
jgi:hypothetical protein